MLSAVRRASSRLCARGVSVQASVLQRLHVRRLSSVSAAADTESYSLTYTYHPPAEVLQAQGKLSSLPESFSAEAVSIEDVKEDESAFDVYRNSIESLNAKNESHNKDADLNRLFQRQIDLEQEVNHSAAVNSISHILKLTEMGKSANLKPVQRILLEWYEPFVARLDAKVDAMCTMHKLQKNIQTTSSNKKRKLWETQLNEERQTHPDLTKHGPILTLLPSEKLAVITMNAVVNHILSSGNRANAFALCKTVADVVETEVNLAKSMGQKLWVKSWQREQVKDAAGKPQIVRALGRDIRKYYDLDEWDVDTKIKVGGALIEYLKSTATVNGLPALVHEAPFSPKNKKKVGYLCLTNEAFKTITEDSFVVGQPKFLPMLVPPTPWKKGRIMRGGYLTTRTPFLRYRNKSQINVLQCANIEPVLKGLDFLGSIPWKINNEVFEVAKTLYARGEVVGEIPTKEIYPMPSEVECFVPKKDILNRKSHKSTNQTNSNSESIPELSSQLNDATSNIDIDDKDVDNLEGDDGLYPQLNHEVDDDEDPELSGAECDVERSDEELVLDMHLLKYRTKKLEEKNRNNHSLRCDIEIKFSIAERFKNDTFYFPWNMDFRGRAYPVPPNLSHMGSDLCRGMLTFGKPKPLGRIGLDWLKCHLCNLFGHNKTSFEARVQWSEDHLEDIFDSARNPLDGKRFWATSENPFQSLAACIEIYKATCSGDPENYMCDLPIHQDGSCNGLQHYAALGRDKPGAKAVNLMPSDSPQDVYSEVLALVLAALDRDILIPEDLPDTKLRYKGIYARFIHGHVNRKVIKQTVMTSVYGVTLTGARAQVMGKLKDKIYGDEMITKEEDDELFAASSYLARLTIDSLGNMFASANQIMDWLAKVATLVTSEGHAVSWTTPLGLPVMQPYVKHVPHTVKTLLQSITLSYENDALPVSVMKQRSAFPPNYVHSLDSTHMLMTALRMKDRGLFYSAVHDSYWTHACDVENMNAELRECFIDLYKKPLLEDLKSSLELRYPNIVIPPVPSRGELDIEEVKKSRYFFH